ncbi:haloacid dehalogenase type II [Pseudohalioglobus sediminis]|uniref:(S)-2-haloacid dehalogenase n=1 Tax=Pseudohalioglobus sediminis TaxID=2606449 RepID=A0A5B0WSU5_9GAMM|nr:haloacid dehalogenase type II [Pseudohalioglobus sediminis]KAA1189993.1 haloacid dehalogenase type II [Pseudohalioglobus sediminis]
MALTLAFDVYGTLIDTHGVVSELRKLVGDKAEQFSQVWRDKQLEYAFRRGLMQNYQPFSICTRDALDYACAFLVVDLTGEQKSGLLRCYASLPAFEDAAGALETLKGNGHRLYAFSNGTADAVHTVLVAAGLRDYFHGVVSVDDLKSFKPNPAVYSHFLRESAAQGSSAWLISSNPFDVIGAVSAGMHAAWVKRTEAAVFDPWGIDPTITVANLGELDRELG